MQPLMYLAQWSGQVEKEIVGDLRLYPVHKSQTYPILTISLNFIKNLFFYVKPT